MLNLGALTFNLVRPVSGGRRQKRRENEIAGMACRGDKGRRHAAGVVRHGDGA